jgi:hypothetical protein
LFTAPRRLIAVTAVVTILFVVGLAQLFLLRFEAGDVYPAYSSLRADPLGTRVLFESLGRVGENSLRRNFRPPDQIGLTSQTTLLVCGLNSNGEFLNRKRVRTLMDHVAESGGRLVLTFSTRLRTRHKENEKTEEDQDGNCSRPSETGEAGKTEGGIDDSGEETPAPWLGAASLGFAFKQALNDEMDDTAFGTDNNDDGRPAMIPWRTPLYFDLKDEAWQTIYSWQQEPVVVQRPWGRGTVVMLADSYLFSNEALRSHRCADLLAWLMVPGHTVVFDEFHHGLAYHPGIATLARQYRLHGVFGALLVVVALLGWRQAAVFVPPLRDERESGRPAMGRDTGQGLVDLARRHIQPSELLAICFDAWQPGRDHCVSESLAAQVQSLVQTAAGNPKQNDPAKTYRQICELLKQGKRR